MTFPHTVAFTTVFDASNPWSHDWWFASFGLLGVAMGILAVVQPELFERRGSTPLRTKARAGFGWFFATGATLWTVASFWQTYHGWQKTANKLRQGQFSVAEGPVIEFQRVPFGGKGWEGFTVDGHRFWYSSYIITPGFHQYASFGGPLREGEYVRVTYRQNLILKLEIAK